VRSIFGTSLSAFTPGIENASPVAPCSIRLVRQNRKRPLKMGFPDGASIGDDRHCAAGITVKRMHQHTRIRCDRAFYPA
jgi:hypothetical protein